MNRTIIDIRNTQCVSVLNDDLGQRKSDMFEFMFRGKMKIAGMSYQNVLFFPECGLQVIDGKYVPREAIHDNYALYLMKKRHGGTERGMTQACDADVQKGDFCILSNCFSRNFAHWTEEVFKVLVLEDFGFTGNYLIPASPSYCREFMQLVGISDDRIVAGVEGPTLFERVFYTTQIGHMDVMNYPEIVFAFRDVLFSACPTNFSLGDRIWLNRNKLVRNQDRSLVNEKEVQHVLSQYGFNIVDFAEYPLPQQIAAARSMKVLGGTHSAAFVHSLFMDPVSTVIECFSPVRLNPSCIELYLIMEHRYHQLVPTNTVYSPYPHGHRLELNINHLQLVMKMLN